ncbi:MAG: glycyl-radical enzyme activating protein [Oscillospiraceae bacterium]|nr:glycyl-radical enzyme activating protein [Oscillospiraceae bacterium]
MGTIVMNNGVLTGKFYDIQGFSVHDGPGIRLTLFMKGCPLRCPWCHSPESQAFHTELNWMEIKCVGLEKCGRCLGVCPHDAISPGKTKAALDGSGDIQLVTTDRSKCDNCGLCAKACMSKALYMCGTDYTVDEIMERVRRELPFFKRSGGGVTISGGECLCQPEFTLEALKRCKAEDIHTAVDTTGFVQWEVIESILPYTDLFLYDLKGFDADLHKQVIGVSNELILDNARRIAAAGGKFQIRIPVMPMYNDSVDAFEMLGRFVLELGDAVEVVQILPYHNLGTVKWERLQANKPIFEATPPSDELIAERRAQLEGMGLKVIVH